MKSTVIVYYQLQDNEDNEKRLKEMKQVFKMNDWFLLDFFIDLAGDYGSFLNLMSYDFSTVNIIYLYSKDNIEDDFYRDVLNKSSKVTNILILEHENIRSKYLE